MKIFTLKAAMPFFQLYHAQNRVCAEGFTWHTNNSESTSRNASQSWRVNKTFNAWHLSMAGGTGFFVPGATFSVNDAPSALFYRAGQQATCHTVR